MVMKRFDMMVDGFVYVERICKLIMEKGGIGKERMQRTRVSWKEAAAEIEAGGRRKEIADEAIR